MLVYGALLRKKVATRVLENKEDSKLIEYCEIPLG